MVAKRERLRVKHEANARHEGAAFVIFHDPNKADEAHYNCSEPFWLVQRATPPKTIVWRNFRRIRFGRVLFKLILDLFVIALSIFFSIPSSFFSSLSSYSEIPGIGM